MNNWMDMFGDEDVEGEDEAGQYLQQLDQGEASCGCTSSLFFQSSFTLRTFM
jgi:hypothetical protein